MLIQGWLLDSYASRRPDSSGITSWIRSADREQRAFKVKDSGWRARIYAEGEACEDPEYLLSKVRSSGLVHSIGHVYKQADVSNSEKRRVLEIWLNDASRTKRLAELLENTFQNPDALRLYNVDVLPEQQYFYDKEIFPLAFVEADVDSDGEVRRWNLLDSVASYDYATPDLRVLRLDVEISDRIAKMDSRLNAIALYFNEEEDPIEIKSSDESQILVNTMKEIDRFDPDLVITRNGDSFVLPFLYGKARKYSLTLKELNRDAVQEIPSSGGKTYFSYGRVMYRPATNRLFGRLHLDEENTFVYDQCRLQGLFEVTRLCRMPLHTSMRASIGKCLSGLQFYYATKRDLLIPWKPEIVEDGKNAYELFVADRGGTVLKPPAGVHEHVGEIDFASLYPSIIRKYNISAETVNCRCCLNSKNMIRELGMHICDKQDGIVARSLVLPLDKRREYKRLRDSTPDEELKKVYNERAAALKWILVTSFGYLSYRHAKFGKIDSHIAVCAAARETLLQAMRTAELSSFSVVHGIVDSLWLSRDRKDTIEDYEQLCEEITRDTGFKLSIEGIYKWIVFLPSKVNPATKQVANRYFGCFEGTDEGKVRGIELRRHDTPLYFKKCQGEILETLYKCGGERELKEAARTRGIEIFEEYAARLERREVSPLELIITKRLSKELEEYSSRRQLSVNAASKLESEGLKLKAGQSVSYVISHYEEEKGRTIPEEFVSKGSEFDSQRYVELLADCCSTVLSPFGVSKKALLSRSRALS